MSIEKPSDDLELLLHVAEDPRRFLGNKSLPLFEVFGFGYLNGLPAGARYRCLPSDSFEEFVRARFPIPERWPYHLSATSYVRFLGLDDSSAFDLYLELRRDYFAAHPAPPDETAPREGSRFDAVLEAVFKRPMMYFGNGADLMGCLVALFNGAIEAERTHLGVSPTAASLDDFQAWMNARHSWALGRPWHRILQFQNLWHSESSITAFKTYFDLFRSGDSPDALTPVAQHMFETNPGVDEMTEAQREDWKKTLSRIFYKE